MIKYWRLYKSKKMFGIYKDKNLKHYGLTSSQILCIMRKFQFIIKKTDEEHRDDFRNATDIKDVTRILNCTIHSIKKEYLRKAYKDMSFYISDYAKFILIIVEYFKQYSLGKDVSNNKWHDGTQIKMEDFAGMASYVSKISEIDDSFKYDIRLIINGEPQVFHSSFKALLRLCEIIGIQRVGDAGIKVCGRRLLVKRIRKGQEERYILIDNDWYLYSGASIRPCVKVMREITSLFSKDIGVEWDILRKNRIKNSESSIEENGKERT